MTYKAKFDASQDRAHSQVIATKILKELGDLRAKAGNSTAASRRWVWELIQNAKDVHPEGGVKIRIEFRPDIRKPHVTFKHNGRPFSADDIRFLIEQISTKDRTKDEGGKRRTTGKFGTGFLTTHLLSDTVHIEGIAKEPGLNYTSFELTLDRSSDDIEGITAAVQRAKRSIENMDMRPPCSNYVEGAFNTAFRYPLEDEVSLKFAKIGLTDLDNCLPYSLAFVEEIESVEVAPGKRFFRIQDSAKMLSGGVCLASVTTTDENGMERSFTIARLTKGFTSIAVPVGEKNGSITLLAIGHDVPRLFCDFPLVGTERFPFPVIINNPNFNPTDPRDGIFLNTPLRPNQQIEENKKFIRDAVELYFQLLAHASMNGWQNLHLLAQTPSVGDFDWLDLTWFRRDAADPIRKQLLHEKIVTTANGNLVAMLSSDDKCYMWFPHGGSSELREEIWNCANSWFPHQLPRRLDVELWHKLSWPEYGKLTVSRLASFVESKKMLVELAKCLVGGKGVFEWLNEFYALMRKDEVEYDAIINSRSVFPNQNGDFCKKSQLFEDAGDIGEEFKDILKLLGRDLRGELVADGVNDEFEPSRVKNRAFAVKEITSEVDQKAGDREVAKSFRPAFRRLLQYFQREQAQAKLLFPRLYQSKHYLYDDEEILDNISKAEQLTDLLTEFSVKNVTELRELIARGTETERGILPVTQEILVSMGITSVQDWMKALEDKELAALFSHESTPTLDMFIYAQSIIAEAKRRIIEHLKSLPEYNLSQMDETAPTILAGVLRNGQSISVVARPGYGGEVIIYYGSERDVLDYVQSELWVDIDGKNEPRQITLGHILKKAQIVKFPI